MALCIEEGAMNINYFEGVVMKGGERKREGRRFKIGRGHSHCKFSECKFSECKLSK
jgi:hypothetical protein